MTPDQIRDAYLKFFADREHEVVASSAVVPEGDKSLLFTNAGMNQFKDVLLGLEKRDYVRAASVQKCVRAGGKHNDLDEVGKSPRHLTFFEMLGNWSFGEYYKREAIKWAWEFVTNVLRLDESRLFISVYDTDDDSYNIWHDEIGIPEAQLTRLGKADNFWAMGPTGPCGPCSEIYFDLTPDAGSDEWKPGFDEGRFIEFWNLVFMESDAQQDGSLVPLPIQSVDTGMGLDRIAYLIAGQDSVFKTGLFSPTLEKIHAMLTGDTVDASTLWGRDDFSSYCVIADHIRTVLFSIVDGARFSNEGRGYVLRRILRRAVRSGRELGFEGPFMHEVCEAVIENFQHVYPSLRLKGREASTTIRQEEERFFRTLERGIALFEERVEAAKGAGQDALSGADVFQLYDTFGFPADLTEIMAEERGMSVDMAGYEAAMQEQKERSRAADSRYEEAGEWRILADGAANTFVGYDTLEITTSVLRFREHDGRVDLTLRESPFYAESGGQVGDAGEVVTEDGSVTIVVDDTRKTTAGITLSGYLAEGRLDSEKLSQPVVARVDESRRANTAAHHTATHLLHTALHKHVSKDAFQAGSLVAPDRLRFDFSYERPVTEEQVGRIEAWVNAQIDRDDAVVVHEDIALSEAEERGAMMMFGEKYGERVRMVQVSDYSLELCGGTHVRNTGELGYFRVVAESGVAAGTRRIEAVVGGSAIAAAEADRARLRRLADALKSPVAQLEDRVAKLDADNRELERKLQSLTQTQANAVAGDLVNQTVDVAGVAVLAAEVQAASRDALLAMADGLRDKLPESAIALLAANVDDKPALLVMVTDTAFKSKKVKAGDLINDVAGHVGGRGGGRPTLAQAGGSKPEGISEAVAAFVGAVEARLN